MQILPFINYDNRIRRVPQTGDPTMVQPAPGVLANLKICGITRNILEFLSCGSLTLFYI